MVRLPENAVFLLGRSHELRPAHGTRAKYPRATNYRIARSHELKNNERKSMFDPIQRWEYEAGRILARRHGSLTPARRRIWFSSGPNADRGQRGFMSGDREEAGFIDLERNCVESGRASSN